MKKEVSPKIISLTFGVLVVCFAIVAYVSAQWAEPTCDPTVDPHACNVDLPLNVSSNVQSKLGPLILNTSITPADVGLSVPQGKVGIGTLTPFRGFTISGDEYVHFGFDSTSGVGRRMTILWDNQNAPALPGQLAFFDDTAGGDVPFRFDFNNSNFVIARMGGGLQFPDGTLQTTAATQTGFGAWVDIKAEAATCNNTDSGPERGPAPSDGFISVTSTQNNHIWISTGPSGALVRRAQQNVANSGSGMGNITIPIGEGEYWRVGCYYAGGITYAWYRPVE